ncbi:MAG: hypothetical protein M3Y87_37335 [Myxococcota bacterium]|nr:hypothetical protein [Myxococcota bacterium]
MTTTTRDDSVMMAIAELRQLEQERTDALRRAEDARRREAQERETQERAAREAARERARMVAEVEAGARIEGELQRDRSLEVLRQQIAAVQAEREAVREELRARIEATSTERGARRGPWALAFGLSSVVAAGLAGMLVMQQQPSEIARAELAAMERPQDVREVVAAEPARLDRVEDVTEPAALEGSAPAAPASASERLTTTRPRDRDRPRERERDRPRETRADALSEALGLEHDDGDEVLSEQFLRDATQRR